MSSGIQNPNVQSYDNFTKSLQNLEEQIHTKDKVIDQLLQTVNILTSSYKSAFKTIRVIDSICKVNNLHSQDPEPLENRIVSSCSSISKKVNSTIKITDGITNTDSVLIFQLEMICKEKYQHKITLRSES